MSRDLNLEKWKVPVLRISLIFKAHSALFSFIYMTCGSWAWSLEALSIARRMLSMSRTQSKSSLPLIAPILFSVYSPDFCTSSSSFALSGVPRPHMVQCRHGCPTGVFQQGLRLHRFPQFLPKGGLERDVQDRRDPMLVFVLSALLLKFA